MFGMGKKKVSVAVDDDKVVESFKQANDKLVDKMTEIQKVQGSLLAIDRDLGKCEQSIIILSQAMTAMETRLIALEDMLTVKNIKFSNN